MSDNRNEKKPVVLPENVQVDYEFEKKIKTFIKDVKKLGIIEEVRRRRYFIKPSALKREHDKKVRNRK